MTVRVALVAESPLARGALRRAVDTAGTRFECGESFDSVATLIACRGDFDAVLAEVSSVGVDDPWMALLDGGVALVLLLPSLDVLAPEVALGLWRRGASLLSADADETRLAAALAASAAGLVVVEPRRDELPWWTWPDTVEMAPRPGLSRTVSESLTARERDVLRLLAEGHGNKRIAARLSISAHTAKYHVGQILRKLDASSRAAAAAIGVREGML